MGAALGGPLTLTRQERGWLERYARETGRSGLRHLNRQVANVLLAEGFFSCQNELFGRQLRATTAVRILVFLSDE